MSYKLTFLFLLANTVSVSFGKENSPCVKQVLKRCHLVTRLSKAIALIKKINPSSISCTEKEIAQFKNTHILHAVHQLSNHNNRAPFYCALESFKRFQFLDSENFEQEITALILLIQYKIKNKEFRTQNISDLPLEQMLEAIDILTHDLPILLDQYEYFSDQTWQAWLKKYWYVPVLVTTIISIRILIKFQ